VKVVIEHPIQTTRRLAARGGHRMSWMWRRPRVRAPAEPLHRARRGASSPRSLFAARAYAP
jgi:hypothetical protein